MKCPRCGYFNIPGATVCGKCQAGLAAAAAAPPSFEELYPPRARDRKPGDRIREPWRRGTRRLLPFAERLREGAASAAASVPPLSAVELDWRPWLVASIAVIPGLGQLWQKRWRRAGWLLLAFAALLLAIVLLLHSPLSDLLMWCALGLSVYSVWDAANISFPGVLGGEAAERLRSMRLGLLSVGIVASTIFCGYRVLAQWYDLWVFRTDQGAPTFLSGDGLIVRRMDHPALQLRRGDLAVYFPGQAFESMPLTERVVGLPGDRITTWGDTTLLVNGSPVQKEHLPLTFRTPLPHLDITVPADTICLWRGVNTQGEYAEGENAPEPYVFVSAGEIRGRAIGLYQPAQRRRWF